MKKYIKSNELPGNYIVRFIPVSRSSWSMEEYEDYYYNTESEAENHINMFIDDDSGLYKRIAVINPSNTVTHVLVFEHGSLLNNLYEDDIVRLRSEYARPEELKYLYRVFNINEDSGRCDIDCLNSNLALGSIETVGLEMIRKVANPKEVLEYTEEKI